MIFSRSYQENTFALILLGLYNLRQPSFFNKLKLSGTLTITTCFHKDI